MRRYVAIAAVAMCGAGITATTASAAPAGAGHVVSTSGARVSETSTAATQKLQLVLPLKAHSAALQRFADAVTDPQSPQYRHFRSIAWLSAHFGASAGQRAKVVAFLRHSGASDIRVDATGMFVDADMRASRAAAVFHTDIVNHSGPHAFTTPAQTPTIPSALSGTVTGVVGLSTAPIAAASNAARLNADAAGTLPRVGTIAPHSASSSTTLLSSGTGYTPVTGTPSGCSKALHMNAAKIGEKTGFSPSQYLRAYNYTSLHDDNDKGQGERVALIEIDGFKQSNIKTFASCFNLHLPKITAYGVGISKPLAAGAEATLDLEVLDAAAPRLEGINVYETSSSPAYVLKALTAPLQNKHHVPQVISASLGLCESQMRSVVGKSGIKASTSALEVAAAHGVSVVAATGDDGSSACVNDDGNPVDKLAVNYPATSKWVTAVGGTQLWLKSDNTIKTQAVWNDGSEAPGYAAGGGVSTLSGGLPSYQRGTVTGSHREVPDVALLADVAPGYDIYCTVKGSENCSGLGWEPVGGTSAAAPLFAGGLALIDQDLRKHKKKKLGMVNPLLYKLGRSSSDAAKVYHDVTTGNNDVAPYIYDNTLSCCTAKVGYDDASGWGGVNLGQLAEFARK
jgi:subtilase family serine protease